MADSKDTRPLHDRRLTRLRLVNLGKTPQGMVAVIIPEGTPVYRVDRDFATYCLLRTWIIEIPEEILYKMQLDGLPTVLDEQDEGNGA